MSMQDDNAGEFNELNQEQHRQAEEALAGMLSNDPKSAAQFIGGEFVEPVYGIGDSLSNEAEQILSMATSMIDVSSDPSIATSLDTGRPSPSDRPEVPDIPELPEGVKFVPGRGFQLDESKPVQVSGVSPDAVQAAGGPSEKPGDEGGGQRRARTGRQEIPVAQSSPVSGVGRRSTGDPPPDFGLDGGVAFEPITANQVALLQEAEAATEAVDNTTEMMVELLRRLTANMLRHGEVIEQLMDKAYTEEEDGM